MRWPRSTTIYEVIVFCQLRRLTTSLPARDLEPCYRPCLVSELSYDSSAESSRILANTAGRYAGLSRAGGYAAHGEIKRYCCVDASKFLHRAHSGSLAQASAYDIFIHNSFTIISVRRNIELNDFDRRLRFGTKIFVYKYLQNYKLVTI